MSSPKANEKDIKIELGPETASGHYSNLVVINSSPSEFFLDFISVVPAISQARVQSRIIMTPDNAKNLLTLLADNIRRYEATFGEIKAPRPKQMPTTNGFPNPFGTGEA